MSCDLTDPAISEAYDEIVGGQDTNWLILGYNDTRDKISLNSKGPGGLDELRDNLKEEEVLYGFLRIENRFVFLTYVSDQVRAVGALFKQAHQVQINASTPNDLTEANVRNRLKLGDPEKPNSPPKRVQTQPLNTPPISSPVQPQSPVSPDQDPEFDEAAAKQESERRAQEDAERQAREKGERDAADRRKAEQVAREAAQRRALEEAEKKKNEALELERKERVAAEAKAKAEVDRKAREEAERKRTEELRSKFAELEKSGKVTLSGYITVQGGGVYFWKRRFFELRGKTLYLFRDETDKLPISKLELDGQVTGVTDAQSDVLILNSFKVDFRSSEPYYFFSDDKKNKELIVAALGRYVNAK
ncbi:17574_t:CDS:2 [Funneliformis geosporum]|uniref:16027_t:CDS:1 n=1 Tax=Funneliformis geosporum TaxID=1117311 RepID=A0A9W4SPL5_9GLOM|nr:16027_t:CDS:2 [Funneliformis geosporum]CAI2178995.1 17574_t:CDS:2 [Funneliformis geosporum]